MGAGKTPGSSALANAAPTTGSSGVCHTPSGLPKPLQPGGDSSLRVRGKLTFPLLIGRGRQRSDKAEDFQHEDFPKPNWAADAVLAATWRHWTDQALVAEMVLVLRRLAGEEGVKAVEHFVNGNGVKLSHPPGSPLARMAFRSPEFLTSFLWVIVRIKQGVKTLSPGGSAPDFSALRIEVPATHWGLKEFGVTLKDPEATALRAILGGTQGEKVYATSLKHDRAARSYELGLRWVIQDHFGVSRDDLYAPGLFPFWVLQHERKGYRPYVNEIVIDTGVRGTY
ncbi:MAG: hypothetical protein KJ062_02880 [Thermoanaerobaculia bacterium]|nr:hypothetical protein [Thermoanaerobaculia bacterium]